MRQRSIARATAAAFAAQGVISAAGVVTALLLAGRLDAASYGLWQLFCMAGGYSGLFHLGICDGIYLRLGGKRYSELDARSLGTVFWRFFLLQITAAAVLGTVLAFLGGGSRADALLLALIYMPVFNADAYLGHILQATGRTVEYSVSTVIERVGFVLLALSAAVFGTENYAVFALLNIAAHLLSLIYCAYRCRDIVGSYSPRLNTADEVKRDIASGGRLLLANLSAQFVSGAARIAVINSFGDAEFGRVSFALTLSGIFVSLTAQMSMVLFPSLRRERGAGRQRIFSRLNSAVCLLFPAALISALPIKYAVGMLLPSYYEGLEYLGILLPLCVVDGAAQLVGTTYMKVGRREGRLFAVNAICSALSVATCFLSASLLGNISSVLLAALAASIIRCCLLESFFLRQSGADPYPFSGMVVLSVIFAGATLLLGDELGTVVFLPLYFVFILLFRRQIGEIFQSKKIKAMQ